MRYETELLSLMSELEMYLLSIKGRYDGLIDTDDLYQECLLNAVQSSSKPNIRNPHKYFRGVFYKTITSVSVKRIREFQLQNNIEVEEFWEEKPVGLIEAIDLRVKGMNPTTRRVWSCLKTFYGDRKMVCKALGSYGSRVDYHKNKLKSVYRQVLEN